MGIVERVLAAALLAALIFGGWNLWRKNVYYDALHTVAAEKVKQATDAENKLRNDLRQQAQTLQNQKDARHAALQKQLAEIMLLPPAERVVYRLHDRWLPVSCPAVAGSGGDGTEAGGLQPADEQFLVRIADEADSVAETLMACQQAHLAAEKRYEEWEKHR